MDKLLNKFINDTKLHSLAVEHAREKGIKRNELELYKEQEFWNIVGDLLRKRKYQTAPTTIKYRCKLADKDITYEEAVKRDFVKVREIFAMQTVDRIIWNAFYQMSVQRFGHWIHPSCKSYKKGESTRSTVKELNHRLAPMKKYRGAKYDITKYFDSVPIEVIDNILDRMEMVEPSCIWDAIRSFYHDNRIIVNGEETERYGSLKQGCAFACLLADIVLYEVDAEMENLDVIYYRYSDDLIIIGKDFQKAEEILYSKLNELGLSVNPDKREKISSNDWCTFLGFKFRRDKVTISEKTLKNMRKKIFSMTKGVCAKKGRALTFTELQTVVDNIQYYLFVGCPKLKKGGMMTYLFGAINEETDIENIDLFIKDCLRACLTDDWSFYTIGASMGKTGTIYKNTICSGRNKAKTEGLIEKAGWYSLLHMYKKFHCGTEVYEAEINKMRNGIIIC